MPPRTFEHVHQVGYADCTVGNHVYYARYLEILDSARGEFFRSLGWPLRELQRRGRVFPAAEIRLRYRAPARYDDALRVRLWVTRLRGARVRFEFVVDRPPDSIVLEGFTEHFCAGLDEKPTRIPLELRQALEPFLDESDSRPESAPARPEVQPPSAATRSARE